MTTATSAPLLMHDLAPARQSFRDEVLRGLGGSLKTLPCKFFYDHAGSLLFERICELPEYYLTRTELSIMRRWGGQMAACLGEGCELIEYGSGSSLKTRVLLDHLRHSAGYVPVDISRQQLQSAARALAAAYPNLEIRPVCADYTSGFKLPPRNGNSRRRVIYFPGSTIGNFEPPEAERFLGTVREVGGPGSALLIGVDLKKDPRTLHGAYNDSAGVTADFNLNLLARINRELHADFVIDRFAHYAFYNPQPGRIEMHLVSLAAQTVHVGGQAFAFEQGESIFTESSHKYTLEQFAQLAWRSGYVVRRIWTDERQWFSVQYLESAGF